MQRNTTFVIILTFFIPFGAIAASPAAQLTEWRNGTDFDCAQMGSLEAIETLASEGSIDAQVYMGWAHWHGTDCATSKDELKSKTWVSLAAEQGDPEAQHALAYFFDRGYELEEPGILSSDANFDVGLGTNRIGKDEEKAMEWSVRAAKQGYAPAIAAVGQYYFLGVVVESDSSEAYRLYTASGQRGYADGWIGAASVMFESVRTAQIMGDTETFEDTSILTMMFFILAEENKSPLTNRLPHPTLFNEYYVANIFQTLNKWMSPEQKAAAGKKAKEILAQLSQ